MKRAIISTAILMLLGFVANAQNDTMYIVKDGFVVGQYNVNTEIDSIVFYKPQNLRGGIFTDQRDNNTYKYITIGSQVWMADNLAYLPQVDTVSAGSEDVSTGKYYYVYDFTPNANDSEQTQVNAAKATVNYQTYGVLYNWNAALDACPVGWHLPTNAEWTTLSDFLGGLDAAGGKMKATGTSHWASPNSGATNESKFNALPAGYRWNGGQFALINTHTLWWSATPNNIYTAFRRYLTFDTGKLNRSDFIRSDGFSVRCLKN